MTGDLIRAIEAERDKLQPHYRVFRSEIAVLDRCILDLEAYRDIRKEREQEEALAEINERYR